MRKIADLLDDYGEDFLLLVLMLWLMPWVHARVLLPEIFPVTGAIFGYTTLFLALTEIVLIHFFVRMEKARQHSQARALPFPALLFFLRSFSLIAVAMTFSDKLWVFSILVMAFCTLAHLYYCYSFAGDLPDSYHRFPKWLYGTVRATLFISMFCLTTSAYISLHDLGAFDAEFFRSKTSEIIAYLTLVAMCYLPTRIYLFIKESLTQRTTIQAVLRIPVLIVVWLLLALEIGTYDPSVLDTALRFAEDPERVTKLNLANSDISQIDEIGRFSHLTYLSLKGNQLTKLPKAITGLKNLQILNLNSNKFSGFPHEILELHEMKELLLSNNRLLEIPSEIDRLRNLSELRLSTNQLESLPESLLRMPALSTVFTDGNPLSHLTPGLRQKLTRGRNWYW